MNDERLMVLYVRKFQLLQELARVSAEIDALVAQVAATKDVAMGKAAELAAAKKQCSELQALVAQLQAQIPAAAAALPADAAAALTQATADLKEATDTLAGA